MCLHVLVFTFLKTEWMRSRFGENPLSSIEKIQYVSLHIYQICLREILYSVQSVFSRSRTRNNIREPNAIQLIKFCFLFIISIELK